MCLARNPQLVYGRMTGWGQDGPLASTAGHDIDYIAPDSEPLGDAWSESFESITSMNCERPVDITSNGEVVVVARRHGAGYRIDQVATMGPCRSRGGLVPLLVVDEGGTPIEPIR